MRAKMVHAQCGIEMVDHEEVHMLRVPVLVILGSTGCGKSRLGIELARRFTGEIISADSMQVYKNLDIITAKVSKEEREMAPHHMLDVADPLTEFTVIDFRDMTLPIIDDLLARKKLPIIVGGTNYYIESLLWKILIANPENMNIFTDEKNSIVTQIEKEKFDSGSVESNDRIEDEKDEVSCSKKSKLETREDVEVSNEELHRRLSEVDPEMADRLHPNNRRKIIRSLEVFDQFGKTHSELLKAQREAGACGLGGPLRHPNSIILWLRCEEKVLKSRLDSRVDAMVEAGMVQELLEFHRGYNEQRIKSNTSPDYSKGIFQSIGFKEFHAYLVLPEEERRSEKGQALLVEGINNLKLVTKRYARRQERWIKNRLVRRNDRQVPPMYTLDCTDLEQWDSQVFDKSVAIISAILEGKEPEQRPFNENIRNEKLSDSSNEISFYCEICERIFIGDHQWNEHINGAKHMRVIKKKKKLEEKREKEMKMEVQESEISIL